MSKKQEYDNIEIEYKKGKDIMKEKLMEETEMDPKEENKEENNKAEELQEVKENRLEEMTEDKKEDVKETEEILKINDEEDKKEDSKKVESEEAGKEKVTEKEVNEEINDKKEKIENKEKGKKDTKNKEKKRDNLEKKSQKKKKRNIKKLVISIFIVAIVVLLFSTVFALTNISNEKIISGVTIEGIEVSGLTKEEAKAKLETMYTEKMQTNIELKYQEFESELNPTLMEVNYDLETAVNEAYSLGRNQNIFVNNYDILGTLVGKRDINVNMSLNEEATKQTINDIGTNLPGIMIESSYSIEEDKLIITRGKEGIVIKTDDLLSQVKDMLNDIHETENIIEIPVETKTPQDIDIDKIHSEIYKEAKDAYYTKDPFTVYPEVEGIDFDVEKAKETITAEIKDEYVIDLIITKPNITVDQIGTEAFPDQLSTFTTRYDASDKDRTTNLKLACEKLNGKVIMPGETFSYNATLGPRTYAAGYKDAKVYESGQVVDGIGGGICQISSTLYNAALMSDMEIVERRNHQFVTSYVGAGRDATVVYGSTDFKFKNTRTYPVKIVASAKSGIATVSIFGIKEADREYTYSFSTETVSTIPYTTKYVEDSSLAPGKEVVKQKGANGLVTKTYMTKRLDGKVISTELLSKDTYSAMQRIINRGKSTTTSTQNSSSTVNTPSTPSTTTQTNQGETVTQEEPETTQNTEQQTQTETTE